MRRWCEAPDFPYSAIRPITIADKNNDRIRRLREGGLSTFSNQAGDSDPHSIDFGAVLQTKTVQPRAPASGVKAIIAVIFLACAAALVSLHFSSALKGTDFPDFYCAARILLDGHAHNLYDAAFQYRYQAEYAGRVGTLYIHPPYEAALYLSVAWLPLRYAYMLWSFLNLLFLAFAARVLARTTLLDWDWQLLPIFALTFVPLLLCLIQGQDSIVLLLLVVLAYANLRRGHNLTSGCWLALGLFKFQLVLPIAIVLLLARSGIGKRAFASGFATVMLALMGLSAAISGWSVFTVYPKFLLHLPAQQFAGIIPQVMPNFRGMVFTVFHHNQSWWSVAIVCVLSAVALLCNLDAWKPAELASDQPKIDPRGTFDLAFSSTVIFALLVSYHLNPHDLTLLLLPISLTLYQISTRQSWRISGRVAVQAFTQWRHPEHSRFSGGPKNLPLNRPAAPVKLHQYRISGWTTLVLLALLFLPPVHLLPLKANLYPYSLIAIALIVLLAAIALMLRE